MSKCRTFEVHFSNEDENMIKNFDDLPLVLSAKEAAAALSISRNTMYELLRCGAIHSVRLGNQFRIPKESIKHLLRQ